MEIDLGKINNTQYSKKVLYDDPTGLYMNTSQSVTLNEKLKDSNNGWVLYISHRTGGTTDKSSNNLLFIPKWFNENRCGICACSETGVTNGFFILVKDSGTTTKLEGRNPPQNEFVLHKIISI